MPILNYTTKIDYHRTLTEISRLLASSSATKIIVDYDTDGLPVSITFHYEVQNQKFLAFTLPCNFQGILKKMQHNKKVARRLCTQEQALRVGWRIIKDWIEAQIALVDADLASMAEVFLPYVVMNKSGMTLYKQMDKENYKPLLP